MLLLWSYISLLSHLVDTSSYLSFQSLLHDWCYKGCGMCYPVCGRVHIKDCLLLIRNNSPESGGCRFPILLPPFLLTVCIKFIKKCLSFRLLKNGTISWRSICQQDTPGFSLNHRVSTHSQLVIRSVPHGEPIELFLIPASAPQLVQQRLWCLLWDGAYKRSLTVKQK